MGTRSAKRFIALVFLIVSALVFAGEKSYKVGDIGPGGGIVFYKNAAGFSVDDGKGKSVVCHYLEVSKEDLGCVTWGPVSFAMGDSETKYGIGEGKAATYEILNSSGKTKLTADNSAAYVCAKYKTSTTNVGDWFLPTSDEIRVLFKNLPPEKMDIKNTEFYWSSSVEKNNRAWARKNKTSTVDSIDHKFMVRAVHAF